MLTFRNVSKDPGQFKICWTWPPAIREDPYAYCSIKSRFFSWKDGWNLQHPRMLCLNKDERMKCSHTRVHTKIDGDGHLSFILGSRWLRSYMGRCRSGYRLLYRIEIGAVVSWPRKSRQWCLLLRWKRFTKCSHWSLAIVGRPSNSRLLKWRLTLVDCLLRWRCCTELSHWFRYAIQKGVTILMSNGWWWWNARWLKIVIVIKNWLISWCWLTIDYAGSSARKGFAIHINTRLVFGLPTTTHHGGREIETVETVSCGVWRATLRLPLWLCTFNK